MKQGNGPLAARAASAANPARRWETPLKSAGALLLAAAITVGVIVSRDLIGRFAVYGYPGVFLFSLLGNATVIVPAPAYAIVFAVGGVLNPILTGIVAGLGASLGELTGYLAGISGRAVITHRATYERLEPILRRYGVFAIAVLALIPNPFFDVAGILSGMLRIPAWQFVLAAWVGKSFRFTILAWGGATSLPLIDKLF